MNIEELKNTKYAFTHTGSFHADDVFSAAFLKIINPNIEIIRGNIVPSDFKGLVFDIGKGEFDHHQENNECRSNGIPYAAFGKLWNRYAKDLYDIEIVKNIDKKLIQSLDLNDNTGEDNQLSYAISLFNPTWENNSNGDNEFKIATDVAKNILEKIIENEASNLKAKSIVLDIYNHSLDKQIIVMDKYYPFKEVLPYTEAIYVIYPSKRGGYAAHGVTKSTETIRLKKDFPKEWVNNPPKYINFCHNSLFLITTNTKEDAIKACKESLMR